MDGLSVCSSSPFAFDQPLRHVLDQGPNLPTSDPGPIDQPKTTLPAFSGRLGILLKLFHAVADVVPRLPTSAPGRGGCKPVHSAGERGQGRRGAGRGKKERRPRASSRARDDLLLFFEGTDMVEENQVEATVGVQKSPTSSWVSQASYA